MTALSRRPGLVAWITFRPSGLPSIPSPHPLPLQERAPSWSHRPARGRLVASRDRFHPSRRAGPVRRWPGDAEIPVPPPCRGRNRDFRYCVAVTSVNGCWWRGFRTSTHLRASDPTKPLVSALPYAAAWAVALLNLGLGVPGPEKRPNFRSTQRVDTCRTSMTAQSTNLESLDP